MNKQIWLQNGSTFSKGSATTVSYTDGLPNGIYEVRLSQTGFYLEKIAESFTFDYKLYGLNLDFINYVMKTYENITGNLGILFSGLKGTGKSVTAKQLCNYLNLPVINVKSMGPKVNSDMINYLSTNIDFDCIFLFDEYEKEFEESSYVLSFMDGVYNSTHRKVFLLTANTLKVDKNLLGRPSRIRYKKEFGNLDEKTCREILNDILKDKSATDKIIELTHSMSIVTIDLIKAMAIDVNIHGIESIDTIKNIFNIEPSYFSYSFIYIHIKDATKCNLQDFNVETINGIISSYKRVKSLKSSFDEKDREFIREFGSKYYAEPDTSIENSELQYMKPGNNFNHDTVLIVNSENHWIVTITEYGELRINYITSCYSCTAGGKLNIVL